MLLPTSRSVVPACPAGDFVVSGCHFFDAWVSKLFNAFVRYASRKPFHQSMITRANEFKRIIVLATPKDSCIANRVSLLVVVFFSFRNMRIRLAAWIS